MIEVLIRDGLRICHARHALDYCAIGAVAITTSGFAINLQRMADLLGFAELLRNSCGCIASLGYVNGC